MSGLNSRTYTVSREAVAQEISLTHLYADVLSNSTVFRELIKKPWSTNDFLYENELFIMGEDERSVLEELANATWKVREKEYSA